MDGVSFEVVKDEVAKLGSLCKYLLLAEFVRTKRTTARRPRSPQIHPLDRR